MTVLVGVDLGGTQIRAAVSTGPATHTEPVRAHTPAMRGPDAVLDAIAEAVRQATDGQTPDGVAIGIPGPLDPATGLVYAAPHLPGWSGLDAGPRLEQRIGCRVACQNDAKLAAYAEWAAGAGRGSRHMLFITVSTGIGGGMVIEEGIYGGTAGTAGEVGHVPISDDGPECGQGHPGCLEGTASGTGIAQRARAALRGGEASRLRDSPDLDAHAVEDAALAGDPLAKRLWDDAGHALGRAIGGYINVLSPDVVVIGGGLINAGDLLFVPMHAAIPQFAFEAPMQRCRIVTAALGTDAGLVGACAWAGRAFGAALPG